MYCIDVTYIVYLFHHASNNVLIANSQELLPYQVPLAQLAGYLATSTGLATIV